VKCSQTPKDGKPFFQTKKRKVSISRGTVGAITELVISTKLMEEGWQVFRNLSPHGSIDLVAIKGESVRKIEVRTGSIGKNGKRYWAKNPRPDKVNNTKPSETAVYCEDGSITFVSV